jgi:serine/threonine protein kinase
MTSSTLTCPDEHELLPLATGEPAAEAIEQHLAVCENCQERLGRLRAELASLRQDLQGRSIPPATEPSPTANPDSKPSGEGMTLDWTSDPAETAAPEPLGPEAVAEARERAEAQPERPGAIGKYLIVETLGTGAQGEVYRVIHPKLGRDMVLKLGRQPVGEDEHASLVAEGRLLADLEHINLVKIYDLDFHKERPFLVMEYVHGRNLEDYARDEPIPPRRAAAMVAKLAGALAMVHRRGIIHRDIKPRNILIDESGEPRLIDFGLARLRHAWSEQTDHTWGGTLAYMAPEQARLEHDRIGPRSDVFGLGAALYFLLTGQPPFVGETTKEIWDRAKRCDFEKDALRIAKVPRRLARICLKALAAEPDQRYPSAEAFQKALKRYLILPMVQVVLSAVCALAMITPLILNLASHRPEPVPSQSSQVVIVTPPPSDPAPLRGEITLWVDERGNTLRRGLRLHQQGAVPIKPGDEVRVEAGVNRPAYLYLFWIGSDGKVAPLYPWKEQDWNQRPDHEAKVESIDLPEVIDEAMPLPPSAPGLETLVLLAREDSPLPRDADTTLERDLAGPQRTQLPEGDQRKYAAIWLENGQEFTFDEQGKQRSAPGPKTRQSDDPVLRIRELLRKKLPALGAYHRAVIVPNQGGR